MGFLLYGLATALVLIIVSVVVAYLSPKVNQQPDDAIGFGPWRGWAACD